jgi:hypothetical protein
MSRTAIAAALGPSIGPAVVTLFGIDVPVVAFGLSLVALLVARQIAAPAGNRKLTARQEAYVTVALIIILFLVVTGQFIYDKPLDPGWAVVWAIGLGMSGLLVLEVFGEAIVDFLRAFFAAWRRPPPPRPPDPDTPPE